MNFLLLAFQLSICSFFQNEAAYLQEWIEYHRLIGCEHFWLYNNNSTDDYLKVLEPYLKEGIVELTDAPSPPGEFWAGYQINAFNDAISKSIGKTKWLALIDIDEFIVPEKGKEGLLQLLKEKEQIEELGGLVLFWQTFGTSNLWEIPAGQTLIESLIYRAPNDYALNHFVKTIVRPERVDFFEIHSGSYKPPFKPYTLSGPVQEKQISLDHPIFNPLRINHYWVRTLKWFYENKLPRLRQFNPNPFNQEEVEELNASLNQQIDTLILNYVEPLKRGINCHCRGDSLKLENCKD